uniref:hypothetical protein n=1 Tax=Streptomyces sp. CA-141956 TaxID=3240051 RepID=UPI003F4989D5
MTKDIGAPPPRGGALGYYATDPERGPRLCFHLKAGSYDTAKLTEVLKRMKTF